MSEESNPQTVETAADIKRRINELTRESKAKSELKDSGLPLTGMIANEINSTPSATPASKPEAESKTQPEKASETATASSVDLKEWAKKKGYDVNTEESVLATLRKADQVFHERQAQLKAKEAAINPLQAPPPNQSWTPPPYQQPAYQNGYSAPPYATPPNPRAIIEELARQNNMLPDDFEKVAKVSREVYEAAAQQDRMKWEREMDAIRIENQKNSVFRELSSDPVFRRPDVGLEFHNILEEMQNSDPRSFEKDPSAYKRAYERALANIGRRNLEGRPLEEGVPPQARVVSPPSSPPRQLGQGSGGSAYENENAIDPAAFAKLPLAEKTKLLNKLGLRTQYQ